jgi:hypothetical protein
MSWPPAEAGGSSRRLPQPSASTDGYGYDDDIFS